LYPKAYRHDRGEEILATLLEASSERGRLSSADLLYLTLHGVGVRWRSVAGRWRAGRLPRSVYVATLFIALLASINLLGAAFSQNGPKNPSSHLDNVVVGLVFVGLDLALWMWKRSLYPLVVGALAVLTATSVVTVDLLVDSCAVIPLVLLIIGRKQYLAQLPTADLAQGPGGMT
jgi:hypothetical protein